MILLMAGTADARELAKRIRLQGHAVLVCTVTTHAAFPYQSAGFSVHTGAMDSQGLVQLIHHKEVKCLVDASHPYAERAHREAAEAARQTDIPYLRFERNPSALPLVERLHWARDHAQAAEMAYRVGGTVFLTVGSRHLEVYARRMLQAAHVRMVVRLLPTKENILKCERLGIDQRDIVAIQGPFSEMLNRALFRQYGASVMVTKESGKEGGVEEKVRAALAEEVQVIVIRRPAAVCKADCEAATFTKTTISNIDALLHRLNGPF